MHCQICLKALHTHADVFNYSAQLDLYPAVQSGDISENPCEGGLWMCRGFNINIHSTAMFLFFKANLWTGRTGKAQVKLISLVLLSVPVSHDSEVACAASSPKWNAVTHYVINYTCFDKPTFLL